MHYTGTIWRPPYEASSLLLEVTAGCTHHQCKFCTLYEELPFKFRMSPMEDIETDLKETKAMCKFRKNSKISRVFLTGANPFVLSFEKLMELSVRIHYYFPEVETIGCFSRITDITPKSDEQLAKLRKAGYNGLTIGMETGDDEALHFMNKGYLSADILKQCRRLDNADIHYHFFYLAGISGAERGELGAKAAAEVCNQLHPVIIGANMLTVYPNSILYQEIQKGNWIEGNETQKYKELHTLVENLKIPTVFAALGASNAFPLQGVLPKDKEALLAALDKIIATVSEEDLQRYRKGVHHL